MMRSKEISLAPGLEVLVRGEVVAIIRGTEQNIATLVNSVAELTKTRLNYRYASSHGSVLFLGNPEQRSRVINELIKLESLNRVKLIQTFPSHK